MIYNDFLPPHRLPFHMAGYFLLGVELLKFDVVPFVYFFYFVTCAFGIICKKSLLDPMY